MTVQATPASDGFVDAGVSARALAGEPLPLVGHVEGFAAAPSLAWNGPAACLIADPAALVTTAVCEGGLHDFTLTATDGLTSASDEVRMVVAKTGGGTVLLEESGKVTAGAYVVGGVNAGALDETHGTDLVFDVVVPPGTQELVAILSWEYLKDDFDVVVSRSVLRYTGSNDTNPEIIVVPDPTAGRWRVEVRPVLAYLSPWSLRVEARGGAVDLALPEVAVPSWAGPIGSEAQLRAFGDGEITWEADSASRRFDDGVGARFATPFGGATTVRAKVTDANGLERVAEVELVEAAESSRPLTVVAVIDSSFSPYHADFLGAQHPWNLDADETNDLDFAQHPAAYLPGYPGAQALPVTLPANLSDDTGALAALDGALWSELPLSTREQPQMAWLPGTKVIGALRFGSAFLGSNGAHGTASASVAAGNMHGSCPECLFVLVAGGTADALAWASAQPWIDVVTNSYGKGGVVQNATLGFTRDNMYVYSDLAATKAASERGQTIVFSAGNGFANAFDAPMFTYWSSEKGPDWMVTVGAVAPDSEQTVLGAGKPVDISSIGGNYPASGGTTVDGVGTHGGTSNAAPVTAGYFAKTIQKAREALGDATPGNAGGVVASGTPVACGPAWPACPLRDGVLTRVELEDLVYANVLPSPMDATGALYLPPLGYVPNANVPSTALAYYYQGHGVLSGRMKGDAEYEAEWRQIADAAVGRVAPYARPEGETAWFIVDSKCRQKLWGAWSGGDYQGVEPALDPAMDPVASAFSAWCDAAPPMLFRDAMVRGV